MPLIRMTRKRLIILHRVCACVCSLGCLAFAVGGASIGRSALVYRDIGRAGSDT